MARLLLKVAVLSLLGSTRFDSGISFVEGLSFCGSQSFPLQHQFSCIDGLLALFATSFRTQMVSLLPVLPCRIIGVNKWEEKVMVIYHPNQTTLDLGASFPSRQLQPQLSFLSLHIIFIAVGDLMADLRGLKIMLSSPRGWHWR